MYCNEAEHFAHNNVSKEVINKYNLVKALYQISFLLTTKVHVIKLFWLLRNQQDIPDI